MSVTQVRAAQIKNDFTDVDFNSANVDGSAATPSLRTLGTGAAQALPGNTKLDDLATPDDNTDLNASTSRHGLLRKLSNVATEFLNGQGNWAAPSSGTLPAGANWGGRLTTESGVPVSTSDRASQATVYYTPYLGNKIDIYTNSLWTTFTFSETSLTLNMTSGAVHDIFGYNNSNSLGLESLAWSDNTTRATGLTTQDGWLVKSGDATRRYLGTVKASGANVTEDSSTKRFVWNANPEVQVSRPMYRFEDTNSWTYSTAAWRQSNNSTLNQLEIVCGLPSAHAIHVTIDSESNCSGSNPRGIAIGKDSTSAVYAQNLRSREYGPTATPVSHHAFISEYPGLGYHFYVWLEYGAATTTWYGDNGGTTGGATNCGMVGIWFC